ncbi:hypothetical protein BaRGS_00029262 [Batillaria attramentaria]|uniref:Uncharacterized protein n=1 Tax=Batillaria attramentaria TaxID=370345 RepID=A0ABD0JXT4_9CAEN
MTLVFTYSRRTLGYGTRDLAAGTSPFIVAMAANVWEINLEPFLRRLRVGNTWQLPSGRDGRRCYNIAQPDSRTADLSIICSRTKLKT